MFDSEDVLEEMKEETEQAISEGEFECEAEGCSSESFDVNLYVADGSHFQGTAICRECNTRNEVNMPVDGMDDLESAFDDLEDTLNDF